jgi:membrane protease YdiL (CAAX protease family)
MTKLIITLIIELIVITPIIFIALNKDNHKFKYLLLFVSYYFFYSILLAIPNWIPALRIIESTWNWSGKIYAITGSILFYIIFRKSLANYSYITFKQNDNSLKPKTYIIFIVFLVTIGLALFSVQKSETRFEDLLFQSTIPGLDEELAFRGIMLGLLSNSLRSKVNFGPINLGNPALLIISTLFGFAHSLHINANWNIQQNWLEFLDTFVIGWILGWMTIKSGSILMSILSHNLINILPIIVWILLKNG